MRDSGFVSMGPNFAKSTFGHGNRSMPDGAPVAGAAAFDAGAAPAAPYASTSAFRMRPLSPLPLMLPRSTPRSRASLRTPGLAYASAKDASSTRAAGVAGDAGVAAGAAADAAGGGVVPTAAIAGAAAGSPVALPVDSVSTTAPSETL